MICDCDCNGHGGSEGSSSIVLQRGDTFDLLHEYTENDVATVLPEGYDLVIGMYDMYGNPIIVGKVSDGTIVKDGNDIYILHVDHEASMRLTGMVRIEYTITSDDRTVVDHAEDIVNMTIDDRYNNSIL